MEEHKNFPVPSDFFVGHISPFLLFELEYHSLFKLLESHKNDKTYGPTTNIIIIGIVAQFEAFCKHQFAALVNIFPNLLEQFNSNRCESKIGLSEISSIFGEFERKIGFVLAEQYDFGSPKLINGLFRDLLSVTVLSKKEIQELNIILNKRNLLVHHGGFYTMRYLKDNSIHEDIKRKAFYDSVTFDTCDCHRILDFLFLLAVKLTKVTVGALKKQIKIKSSTIETKKFRLASAHELSKAMYDVLES